MDGGLGVVYKSNDKAREDWTGTSESSLLVFTLYIPQSLHMERGYVRGILYTQGLKNNLEISYDVVRSVSLFVYVSLMRTIF